MTPPPLAIVQARMGSTRLPRKMLLPLGGRPLVWWAWHASVQAFGDEHVVCAIPASEGNDELADVLRGFGANVFRWDGPEDDVLGRFHACAHRHRWHPDSVIVRVTPDDPFKVPYLMRLVAAGERHPVELGAEAFTLGMLSEACRTATEREHVTVAVFGDSLPPPPPPEGVWTVDTPEDYEAVQALAKGRMGLVGWSPA